MSVCMYVRYTANTHFRDVTSKGNDDSASKLLTAPVKISEDTKMLGQHYLSKKSGNFVCVMLLHSTFCMNRF